VTKSPMPKGRCFLHKRECWKHNLGSIRNQEIQRNEFTVKEREMMDNSSHEEKAIKCRMIRVKMNESRIFIEMDTHLSFLHRADRKKVDGCIRCM